MRIAHDAVGPAIRRVPDEAKAQAYQAWLGFYKGSMRAMKMDAATLVSRANDFAHNTLGYVGERKATWTPPGLYAKTVGQMGLKGTPGLNIVKPPVKEKRSRD